MPKHTVPNIALIDPTKTINTTLFTNESDFQFREVSFNPHTPVLFSALLKGNFQAVLWRVAPEGPLNIECFSKVAERWPIVVVVAPEDEDLLSQLLFNGAHNFVSTLSKSCHVSIALIQAVQHQISKLTQATDVPRSQVPHQCAKCFLAPIPNTQELAEIFYNSQCSRHSVLEENTTTQHPLSLNLETLELELQSKTSTP